MKIIPKNTINIVTSIIEHVPKNLFYFLHWRTQNELTTLEKENNWTKITPSKYYFKLIKSLSSFITNQHHQSHIANACQCGRKISLQPRFPHSCRTAWHVRIRATLPLSLRQWRLFSVFRFNFFSPVSFPSLPATS